MAGEFNSDYRITLIKIVSIMYVTILYAITGLLITTTLDRTVFDSKHINTSKEYLDKQTTFEVFFDTAIIIGILASFSYIARNLVQLIPFPLNGMYGFDYMRVKEVSSGAVITVFLFAFSGTISKKYSQLKYKLDM